MENGKLQRAIEHAFDGESPVIEVLVDNRPASIEQACAALDAGNTVRVWDGPPQTISDDFGQRDGVDISFLGGILFMEFLVETTNALGESYIYHTP